MVLTLYPKSGFIIFVVYEKAQTFLVPGFSRRMVEVLSATSLVYVQGRTEYLKKGPGWTAGLTFGGQLTSFHPSLLSKPNLDPKPTAVRYIEPRL